MNEDSRAIVEAKNRLRHNCSDARKAMSVENRLAARRANSEHLVAHLTGAGTVCGFVPLPSEPLEQVLLDVLSVAGVRVLVPVVTGSAPLDWCHYPSPTVSGPLGIAEPVGPRLGPEAIVEADIIVVPALAVDLAGHRLGRGGGHYDRSLALLAEFRPQLIGVLFDDEFIDEVPSDSHDHPLSAIVTPATGLRTVGN